MNKRIALIALVSLLLLAGVFALLESRNVVNFFGPDQVDETSILTDEEQPTNTVDYSPAKPTDNDEINQRKEQGFDQPQTNPTPAPSAIVTITRANVTATGVDINALLSGVNDGTCTASMTQGATVLTATSSVKKQDQYIYCDSFAIDRSKLSEGKWEVSVSVISNDGTIAGTGSTELQI